MGTPRSSATSPTSTVRASTPKRATPVEYGTLACRRPLEAEEVAGLDDQSQLGGRCPQARSVLAPRKHSTCRGGSPLGPSLRSCSLTLLPVLPIESDRAPRAYRVNRGPPVRLRVHAGRPSVAVKAQLGVRRSEYCSPWGEPCRYNRSQKVRRGFKPTCPRVARNRSLALTSCRKRFCQASTREGYSSQSGSNCALVGSVVSKNSRIRASVLAQNCSIGGIFWKTSTSRAHQNVHLPAALLVEEKELLLAIHGVGADVRRVAYGLEEPLRLGRGVPRGDPVSASMPHVHLPGPAVVTGQRRRYQPLILLPWQPSPRAGRHHGCSSTSCARPSRG